MSGPVYTGLACDDNEVTVAFVAVDAGPLRERLTDAGVRRVSGGVRTDPLGPIHCVDIMCRTFLVHKLLQMVRGVLLATEELTSHSEYNCTSASCCGLQCVRDDQGIDGA